MTNPYASTFDSATETPEPPRKAWIFVLFDVAAWGYPIAFLIIAFVTTYLLRSASISISPMQYDSYFEKQSALHQSLYDLTLLLLVLSPLVAVGTVVLQISVGIGCKTKWRSATVTTGLIWLAMPALFGALNIPILEYLID